MERGLVVKSSGTWFGVLTDGGELVQCAVKGNFRIKGIKSTSPVVIGDRVSVADGFITEVEDRKNYIIRKSINLSKQSHILAANLDQVVLVVTVSHPTTSTTFIDRFLASAEAYDVPAVLVFNKVDLLGVPKFPDNPENPENPEREYLEALINLYETVGYRCLKVSGATGEGIDELRALLEGKVTLFSGHSGVGKSTLINRLIPGLSLRTAEISDAYDTGKHTTTYSEMFPLADPSKSPLKEETLSSRPLREGRGRSFIIDTPGIKGFGSFDMEKEDIGDYFKEIFRFSKDCRFNNCTHTHEPGCAVLAAVERHDISESRYKSYLSMLNDEDEAKYREEY